MPTRGEITAYFGKLGVRCVLYIIRLLPEDIDHSSSRKYESSSKQPSDTTSSSRFDILLPASITLHTTEPNILIMRMLITYRLELLCHLSPTIVNMWKPNALTLVPGPEPWCWSDTDPNAPWCWRRLATPTSQRPFQNLDDLRPLTNLKYKPLQLKWVRLSHDEVNDVFPKMKLLSMWDLPDHKRFKLHARAKRAAGAFMIWHGELQVESNARYKRFQYESGSLEKVLNQPLIDRAKVRLLRMKQFAVVKQLNRMAARYALVLHKASAVTHWGDPKQPCIEETPNSQAKTIAKLAYLWFWFGFQIVGWCCRVVLVGLSLSGPCRVVLVGYLVGYLVGSLSGPCRVLVGYLVGSLSGTLSGTL